MKETCFSQAAGILYAGHVSEDVVLIVHVNSFKREHFLLLVICLYSFFIQLFILYLVRNDPAFTMPVIDSYEFHVWAQKIINGTLLWTRLQNHTPLYPYFIAVIYKLFGVDPVWVATVQYLIGIVSCVLIFCIAKKQLNKTIGLLAAFLFSSYWFFIYAQSFLFSENLSLFLNLLLIYILLTYENSRMKYFIAGIIFGFSILSRPDILLFSFFIFIWLVFKVNSIRLRIIYYSLFLLGSFILMVPVLLQNYRISKKFPVLRTLVGLNFYIGNNPDMKGTSIQITVGENWNKLISANSNNFYLKETFRMIIKDPSSWIKFLLQKIFSIVTGRDFLTSEDVYFFNSYISNLPIKFVSTKLLFISAIIGFFISFKKWRNFLLLYSFMIAFTFMLFFPIRTRYFLPLISSLIIFSALTFYCLYKNIRYKRISYIILIILIFITLYKISQWNPLKIILPNESETYYLIATHYYNLRRDNNKAIEYYIRSIESDPKNITALNDIGVVYLRMGNCNKALVFFEQALQIDKDNSFIKKNYLKCKDLIDEKDIAI